MTRSNVAVLISVALLICAVSLAGAASEKGEKGKTLFVPGPAEQVDLGDGRIQQRGRVEGFMLSDSADSDLRLANTDCTATWIISADGSSRTGTGSCDTLDADGDAMFMWWKGDEAGGTWQMHGGTGKWVTVKGSGSWTMGKTWPDGKYVVLWEGNWSSDPDTAELHNPLDTGGD